MINSKQNLDEFVNLIKPTLEKLGFTYKQGNNAVSSGGEFANCFFIKYARKPHGFKPGVNGIRRSEARVNWRSGVKFGMIWLWPDI